MLSPWRVAEFMQGSDQRHPDLTWQQQLHGSVHTHGGRVLFGHRTANSATFNDPAGWNLHNSFEPSQLARQGASAYSSLAGLPDPHGGGVDYNAAARTPQSVSSVAQAYDGLPNVDPSHLSHFHAMANEVGKQHDFMTNRLGIQTQTVDHDPYSDVHEMMHDVNNNKTLKVMGTHVTGAHPLFSNADNDKFRAVHDFFGHAATGRSFDRHGEQAAYLAHAQMFSPHALPALASETKGQNSSLIYNGSFGPQKIAAMSPEHYADATQLNPVRVSSYREAAAPAFDDDWKEQAMGLINHPDTGGGYTLRDRPGDAPTNGTMVSLPRAEGHEENHVDADSIGGDDVADYVTRKWDTTHSRPDQYAGGWANTGDEGDGKFYQDVSRNVKDPWEAAGYAMGGGQLGVYDLDGYYTHDGSPSEVPTRQFFHDQIAKGGKRD